MAKASRRITAVVAFLLLAGAAILATGPHKRLGGGEPREEAPVSKPGKPLPALTAPRVVVEKRARRLHDTGGDT